MRREGTKPQRIAQRLPARDLALILLSLLLLIGGFLYPGYRWIKTRLDFYASLTDPGRYSTTFRRPAQEALTWQQHLAQVADTTPPFLYEEEGLLQTALTCARSPYCTKALAQWAQLHPTHPWGNTYYLAVLLGAALPLAFVRGLRRPVAEVPAKGYLASFDAIKERQEDMAKGGRPILYLDSRIHKDATFVGLVGQGEPTDLIDREPVRHEYLQLPSNIRERHILVVAGTGAGKTSTYAYNQIISSARNGMGVILIDQKWGDESGLIHAIPIFSYYRRPVYVFAPFSSSTPRLPILEGLSTEDTNDAMEFAQMIVPAADDASVQHYRENDWALLAALVIAEVEHAKKEERAPDLGRVVELLSLESKDALEAYTQISPVARILAAKIFSRPAAKLDEAIPGLRNKLLPFINPVVRRATTRGPEEENLNLNRILQEPALFYVGVPQTKVKLEDGKVLLRLIKHYIDRAIFSQAQLPVPYNFILDEFANFGFLPNMDHNLALIRSKRVSMHIILQSVEQAMKVYGEEGWHAIARNNFNTEVWYVGDLSAEVQEELARKIGETTVYTESYTESRTELIELIPKRSYGIRATKRNLLGKEEMARAKPGTAVIRLPYVGWTLFRAVPLFDPRNPFHRDWQEMQHLLPAFAAAYRTRRRANRPEEVRSLTSRPLPPTPGEKFRKWVERLLELSAPIKVARGPQDRVSRVDFPGLSPALLPKEWFENKLLRLNQGNVVSASGRGLEALSSLLPKLEEAADLRRLLEAAYQRGLLVTYKGGKHPVAATLGIVDLPSQAVYVPPTLAELHERGTPLTSRPSFLPPGEWRAIRGGPMLYGLLAYTEGGDREMGLLYAESLSEKEPLMPA